MWVNIKRRWRNNKWKVRKKASWPTGLRWSLRCWPRKKRVAGNGSNGTDEGQWALEHLLLLPLPRRCLTCDKLIKRQTFASGGAAQGQDICFLQGDGHKNSNWKWKYWNRERLVGNRSSLQDNRQEPSSYPHQGRTSSCHRQPNSGVGSPPRGVQFKRRSVGSFS